MILKQIGIIHSPYKERKDAPRQGRTKEALFELEIFEEFAPALKDVETASHVFVLYWCDRADRETLVVNTPWDNQPHGVFATRSPARPNPIALDIADVISRKENKLIVRGMDALDKSPLIDIKPYNTRTDSIADAKLGWYDAVQVKSK